MFTERQDLRRQEEKERGWVKGGMLHEGDSGKRG